MTNLISVLDEIAENSRYAEGLSLNTILYSFEILQRHIKDGRILEMGPAEGHMTELLVKHYGQERLSIVEGSKKFADELQARYPEASVAHSLFEEFKPEEKFDTIVLGHVLEHVYDPVAVLEKASEWLNEGGIIFGAVPNAQSIHRQAAVIMGLQPAEDSLNTLDIHHGHQIVFNPISFRSAFSKAGLSVDYFGGYWFKPLSNGQIEKDWTPEMIEAFFKLGERYPDIAAEIYVVASKAK